jgi:LPS export ABC transporter protein LptC
MNRARSRLHIVLPILLVALLAGCEPEAGPPANAPVIDANAPDQESRNTTLIVNDSNWTKVRLQTGRARKYTSKMETLLDSGVYVEFFDRNGATNATLIADSARIDDRSGDMSAYGAVHVESPTKKTTVDTERLFYKSKEHRLRSDAHVSIKDDLKGRTLQGVGFESDDALQNYTIFKPVGRTTGAE